MPPWPRPATGPRNRTQPYPLTGHLVGLCGGNYHGAYRRDRDLRQYKCTNTRPEKAEMGQLRCADARFDADAIESVVWRAVCDLLAEPERLLRMASDYLGLRADQVEVERDQLADVERRLAALDRAVAAAYAERKASCPSPRRAAPPAGPVRWGWPPTRAGGQPSGA